ncbi:MAG: FAD-binding protein [Candidatus Lokiarchaeota archaeon]|nr:FAD-binding protein [Candidatus Lokiarchaeota archaeon]
MEVEFEQSKCIKCGLCKEACNFNAIIWDSEGYPIITDECKLCGVCIRACPEKALKLDRPTKKKRTRIEDYKGILVFGEQRDSQLLDVTFELLSKGRTMADELGEDLICVALGNNIINLQEIVKYGADRVYYYNHPDLKIYNNEVYSNIVSNFIKKVKPSIFLIGATFIGRELGPRVAAHLRTGLTADCTGLDITEEKLLLQTRPAFGGNIMASIICPDTRPQCATIRPKVMKMIPIESHTCKFIEKSVQTEDLHSKIKVLDEILFEQGEDITNAEVIVSGGMGLGKKEGFDLLEDLANKFDGGSSVGASRPTVDEGWVDYPKQVGMSGKTVTPKLYIACGISGSVQHKVGMETSEIIVAINKDEHAPIFDIADFGIVGDLYTVIPKLIEMLRVTDQKILVQTPQNVCN